MRLIDADALGYEVLEEYGADGGSNDVNVIYGMIINAPTVDAEPIVRCKDCKHRDPEDKKCDCGHGIMWQLPRADEWFCADGEVKQ